MTRSSWNVLSDLRIPDAAELYTKVRRAVVVNHLITKRRLSDAEVAVRLHVSRRKVSSLKKYELEDFSAKQLHGFLRALGGGAHRRLLAHMQKPPHPGEVLMDTVLRPDGGITVAAFAEHLRFPRRTLSRVVNGKAAVSAELAIRLAAALRGSAESWLRMQLTHDLWRARKKRLPNVRPLGPGRSSRARSSR
jgi:addiction module HigA family antidote